ncbi:hypothetical protein HK100_003619 [Physocladia obscura]|uniref:Bola-like protein n=1 Tax=Physocladia obscura TaxID=109957 RepID=A0AAD5STS8_9FUNG|nr:hypothetical protein HK100_003619 [Physocladia obscura]
MFRFASTAGNVASRLSFIYPASNLVSKTKICSALTTPSPLRLQYQNRGLAAAATATTTPSTDGEKRIFALLESALVPQKLNVKDVSGGCGAMYAVEVASEKFRGQPLVKQHRMVVAAIESEIKSAHGVQIKTEIPKQE